MATECVEPGRDACAQSLQARPHRSRSARQNARTLARERPPGRTSRALRSTSWASRLDRGQSRRAGVRPSPTLTGEARVISGHVFLRKREWALLASLMTVVSALTAAEREHLIPLSVLAASPHAVGEARLWSLLTSALLVQSPLFWSLASFALLGALTLKVCGTRVLLSSALAGHVPSPLVVFALLALAWTFDPRAFEAVLGGPDHGVSAILAALVRA